MKTYSEAFDVVPNDLDDLNHVNNIRYVEWIQEISKRHWKPCDHGGHTAILDLGGAQPQHYLS